MAFTILLQQNKVENNVVAKSPTTLATLNGTLRDECSIIDPIITFEGDITQYALANYMYISQFKRYYFINNITSISQKLFEVSGHVDVLMSFKEQILNNTAIIQRQESNWNLYINDGSFMTYQNPALVTKKFPQGFNTQQFILAVSG